MAMGAGANVPLTEDGCWLKVFCYESHSNSNVSTVSWVCGCILLNFRMCFTCSCMLRKRGQRYCCC